MNNIPKFKRFLLDRRKRIDDLLHKHLTTITRGGSKELADAMRYVVLNGGKRLRSLLLYAVGETYKANVKTLDDAASAIEMIHSFSLVHDDLPAMDNDSLRRGKPTCHIAFDEATAILTGDALAIATFQILSATKTLSAEKKIEMIKVLAEAAGSTGMAGGQHIDLYTSSNKLNKKQLEKMYLLKTGVLIGAAVKLGAIAAGVNKRKLNLLEQFALNIGLAFQIQDDILNIESSADRLGKNVGTDSAQNKVTYSSLVGIEKAKTKIELLWYKAQEILQQLKIKDGVLRELTNYIMRRNF